jgi:hypothetical protein
MVDVEGGVGDDLMIFDNGMEYLNKLHVKKRNKN